MTMLDDLKVVAELMEKATALWDEIHAGPASKDGARAWKKAENADQSAANEAYAFLRTHATELEGLAKDAERYRYLRETNRFKHYVDGVLEREDKIDNDTYDAAVDHAMAYANDTVSAALASREGLKS